MSASYLLYLQKQLSSGGNARFVPSVDGLSYFYANFRLIH